MPTDEPPIDSAYRHTHASRRDGSPAQAVRRDPFTLRNEDGDEWTDDPGAWRAIEPPSDSPAFRRAVDIVMDETSCDVEQWAVDAVNCLIEAGWTPPADG